MSETSRFWYRFRSERNSVAGSAGTGNGTIVCIANPARPPPQIVRDFGKGIMISMIEDYHRL